MDGPSQQSNFHLDDLKRSQRRQGHTVTNPPEGLLELAQKYGGPKGTPVFLVPAPRVELGTY